MFLTVKLLILVFSRAKRVQFLSSDDFRLPFNILKLFFDCIRCSIPKTYSEFRPVVLQISSYIFRKFIFFSEQNSVFMLKYLNINIIDMMCVCNLLALITTV